MSCGRALIEMGESVEAKVLGILVVTEAMWMCPSLAAGDQNAINTVKKAITLLSQAKVYTFTDKFHVDQCQQKYCSTV